MLTYAAKCKRMERDVINRFYELVLALDPNYVQSLGEVRTTISDRTLYKIKRQAAADVAAELKQNKAKS